MTEPDRIIIFRVTWEDDDGNIRANRAWRVQFNNSIGPYKGGLRFHPSVTQSVLKFLGFEQVFKNSLTGLPMGGAKGGSNFNPKGKSDREVMRFCQSDDRAAPPHRRGHRRSGRRHRRRGAGDQLPIRPVQAPVQSLRGHPHRQGAGLRRQPGAHRGDRLRHASTSCENMLEHGGRGLGGKTLAVSGSGNVAIYCIEKLNQLGAKVVTASDSSGLHPRPGWHR